MKHNQTKDLSGQSEQTQDDRLQRTAHTEAMPALLGFQEQLKIPLCLITVGALAPRTSQ